MRLPRNKNILENARNLRKNMTKEERHLWYDFLCDYPIRFRRQEIIGSYIADFYCDKAKLMIELDGSQHYEESGRQRDAQRTVYMESLGMRVLRFDNCDVMQNFAGVCQAIQMSVNARR